MIEGRWEFWIDVGGTFTDCLAKLPDGSIRRHKLPSSGVTKGRMGSGSLSRLVFDAARRGDPAEFWTGWRFVIVGDGGGEIDSAEVIGFDTATGQVALSGLQHEPAADAAYELRCDLDAPVIAIRYL